jgi:ubiquinone/menaquinone biosynthesis C-methylase UbiE
MYEEEIKNNINRFSGFTELYDLNRPETPVIITDILTMYLTHAPSLVIDLGCGTGLSTFIWCDKSEKIIGIEPNTDMINQAIKNSKLKRKNIKFINSMIENAKLEPDSADIITCSQSFHWMDPVVTLKTVSGLLKNNGIFAVYDCDWPPSISQSCEHQYSLLMNNAKIILDSHRNDDIKIKQWNKDGHLKNIRESNIFKFTKEIVFHNIEPCSCERFIGLALSQGHIQTAIRNFGGLIEPHIEDFKNVIKKYFEDKAVEEIIFSYRLRIGIK